MEPAHPERGPIFLFRSIRFLSSQDVRYLSNNWSDFLRGLLMGNTASRPKSEPRGLLHCLVCAVCFVLGLSLTCYGIGRRLPFPDVTVVRPKLDWLARHGDEFDLLVIGSSRVQ